MLVSGIIAEFNPLHTGHAYLINAAKTRQHSVIAAMSGSFVQRGEPAIFDKHIRTEAALCCGADVVLELPTRASLCGAQGFARAGVALIDACGVADRLVFGSECGDTAAISAVAALLSQPGTDALIKEKLSTGIAYAAARQAAIEELGADAAAIKTPNDILGVEYTRAVSYLGASLTTVAVKRKGAGHDSDATGETVSSSALRQLISDGGDISAYIPPAAQSALKTGIEQGRGPLLPQALERAMLAALRRLTAAEFAKIRDVSEGLECRIERAVKEECTIDGVIAAVKSKRYAYARIRRIMMNAYLGFTSEKDFMPRYIRILGFRRSAAALVGEIRANAKLPVIQHPASDARGIDEFYDDVAATDIRAAFSPRVQPAGGDYREFPVII